MNQLTVHAIVQARMSSTRLPSKVMKEILGKPLLGYVIDRIEKANFVDKVIIATTAFESDNPIAAYCAQHKKFCYRYQGDSNDVLSRYWAAAQASPSDLIVRITSDCPLTDPVVIDTLISKFISEYPKYDYVSNTLDRTYPRGLDVEVFSYRALEMAAKEASEPYDREHVTPYFYKNSSLFSLHSIRYGTDYSKFRWTVDTLEDFHLISKLIETLYPLNPEFTFHDLLECMYQHKNWEMINAHVQQK